MAILRTKDQEKFRIAPPIAASSAFSTVETVLGGASNALPAYSLKAGDNFRVTIHGTCTSTGTATPAFGVRVGPLGTVSDPAILSATFAAATAAGTAQPFSVIAEWTVRTISTPTAVTVYGTVRAYNGSTTAGTICFAGQPTQVIALTPSTFTMAADFFVMPTMTGGTNVTLTIQNCIIEKF